MTQIFNMFRRPLRIGLAIGLVLAFFGITSALTATTGAHERLDCDSNAVIHCGIDHHNNVNDIDELKGKYRENQNGDVQAVFKAFGMENEAAFDGMVEGRVTGNNEVYVGDRRVATSAYTAGRQNMSNERGSSQDMGGGRFWYRQPSVSFADPNGSLQALVKMDGDNFRYAVILACGNPVRATPVQQTPPQTQQPQPQAQPNFEVVKDVRVAGQTQWQQEVRANPGDRVEFRITVRNTGQMNLEQVRVRDELQAGMTRVGSVTVSGQQTQTGDLFSTTGLTLGTVQQGQQRELTFTVTVDNTSTTTTAGCTRLRNTAFARHGGNNVSEKQDDAYVQICREATPTTTQPTVTPAVATPTTTPQTTPIASVQPQGKTMPVTGVSGIFGLFAATALGGGAAHYVVTRRLR